MWPKGGVQLTPPFFYHILKLAVYNSMWKQINIINEKVVEKEVSVVTTIFMKNFQVLLLLIALPLEANLLPLKYLLEHNKLQIRLYKQIHTLECISTMLGVRWSPPLLALHYIFPSWFIQCIWDISTLTSHEPHGFIQTLFTHIPLTITIL